MLDHCHEEQQQRLPRVSAGSLTYVPCTPVRASVRKLSLNQGLTASASLTNDGSFRALAPKRSPWPGRQTDSGTQKALHSTQRLVLTAPGLSALPRLWPWA